MKIRTGNGFDVHAFAPHRKLVLCGTEIPCDQGLDGHSDADVAVHALIDAILGALALGDIGMWFPDHDDAYLNIDSMLLLEKVLSDVRVAAWEMQNCDVTIIAQKPKLGAYRDAMRQNLGRCLKIGSDQISVKFTTTEHLGFTGRGEGIAAIASVTLTQ